MEVLYIPQLDETSTEGDGSGAASRYKLLKKTPEDGRVGLEDKAVNRIEVDSSDALTLVFPAKVKGLVRDFFVRLVITADEIPEITFTGSNGETISFEDVTYDVLSCDTGVNVFAFTETDEGIFMVNRRQVDVEVTVSFDATGGTPAPADRKYTLGAKYGSLPTPSRDGYDLTGWFTEAEGGDEITADSTVRWNFRKLYAQWIAFVDPFVEYICPAKNLVFRSNSEVKWTIDTENYASEPGSACSGAIGDNQSTELETTVNGTGHLTFKWRTSSEENYDKLSVSVDGKVMSYLSGDDPEWKYAGMTIAGAGDHKVVWTYSKDSSASSGSDRAWVDEVVWTPEG